MCVEPWPIRVALLISDPEGVERWAYALAPGRTRTRAFQLTFPSSWQEVREQLSERAVALAVVQPDFPRADPTRTPERVCLERLRAVSHEGQLVLYLCPQRHAQRTPSEPFHRLGLPLLLVKSVDDDAASLLRVMARAWTLRTLSRHSGRLPTPPVGAAIHPLLLELFAWPPPTSVQELAHRLLVSPRHLRRVMRDLRLPPPGKMLRWARLLEAAGLAGMGIPSATRLASILGLRDPRAIPRLCRELTGHPLAAPIPRGTAESVFSAFIEEMRHEAGA